MKGLAILVAIVYVAQIRAERDWSNIKPIDVYPFGLNFKDFNVPGSRIVGGEEVKPNSLPYQVALLIDIGSQTAFCGGSLISKRLVMTAAHCIDKAKEVEVILGAHEVRDTEESTQQRIVAKEFIVHERWIPFLLINDIGLIKLPVDAVINKNIQLIALPCHSDKEIDLAEKDATVSGWGKDSDKAEGISPVLRHVERKIMSNDDCNKYFFGIVRSGHMCTNGKGGKGACSGDSGGPLTVTRKNNEKVQCGIVSFGIAIGCEIGFPSAFTRVTSYLEWIEEHTGISCK